MSAKDLGAGKEQAITITANGKMSAAGRKLDMKEKKQSKAECSEPRKFLSKTKPEKMKENDLNEIPQAMQRLESSSTNACAVAEQENT